MGFFFGFLETITHAAHEEKTAFSYVKHFCEKQFNSPVTCMQSNLHASFAKTSRLHFECITNNTYIFFWLNVTNLN